MRFVSPSTIIPSRGLSILERRRQAASSIVGAERSLHERSRTCYFSLFQTSFRDEGGLAVVRFACFQTRSAYSRIDRFSVRLFPTWQATNCNDKVKPYAGWQQGHIHSNKRAFVDFDRQREVDVRFLAALRTLITLKHLGIPSEMQNGASPPPSRMSGS